MLVDAIVGKTPIISCEIAGEKNMVLDMGSEVTILQEWWFNEYLMASVDCLEDASSWLRLEAANSLGRCPMDFTCNSPATFQRLMHIVFREEMNENVLIFLDDIIIYSSTIEEHFERLALVFQRLASHGLKIEPTKCYLCQKPVSYLGQIISDQGISADPEKVKAVSEWPVPENARELTIFLGTARYH